MVSFDSAAGVQKQDHGAFALGVEERMARDVKPPVVGGFVGSVAKLHLGGRWTFP